MIKALAIYLLLSQHDCKPKDSVVRLHLNKYSTAIMAVKKEK